MQPETRHSWRGGLRRAGAKPLRFALLYLAVAVGWITVSDMLVAWLRPEDPANLWLQLGKGVGFVALTATALFWMLYRARDRELRARLRAEAMRLLGTLSDGILRGEPALPLLEGFGEGLRREFGVERVMLLELSPDGLLLPPRGDSLEKPGSGVAAPPSLQQAIRSDEVCVELPVPEGFEAVLALWPGAETQPLPRTSELRLLVFGLRGGEGRSGALLLLGNRRSDGWADARRLLGPVAHSLSLAWETAIGRQRLAVQDRALREAANAVVITDAEGRVEWVNAAFERLTGYALPAIRGRGLGFLRSGAHPDSFYARLWQTLRAGRSFEGEFVNRRRDGGLVTVSQTISPVHGTDGQLTHFLAIQEDVTARKAAQARIDYLARHDALTGLPNRAAFAEELRGLVGTSERLAVMMVDIDRFQSLNTMLGYEVGDQVLVEMVARLREAGMSGDLLARLGGDEFVLLHRRAGRSSDLSAQAERLLAAIARPMALGGRDLEIRASIGIAVHPDDAPVAGDLMTKAEVAQRRCKREGGAGYRFFSEAIDAAARASAELEQELRVALADEQFELYYQPLIDLRSDAVVGVEALLRWHHPTRGVLGPGQFIGLAEETGLIVPIGEWALRSAARQGVAWARRDLPPLRIGVNLSFAQFAGEALADRIAQALAETGLPPERLELELTESLLARDMDLAIATCDRLRALGVRLAIDDFGTGYSSLSHLRRFAVDHLKIDRSFVAALEEGEGPQAIVRATVGMAHALGCRLIAEGVETETQRRFLAQLGCDEGQGYLFARPMPAREVEGFIRRRDAAAAARTPGRRAARCA